MLNYGVMAVHFYSPSPLPMIRFVTIGFITPPTLHHLGGLRRSDGSHISEGLGASLV